MSYLKDFIKRINLNDYPAFLQLWEEYCYSDEIDPYEFIEILENVKKSPLVNKFGNHVEKGLVLWKLIKEPNLSHEAIKLIYDIENTNSENLAQLALDYLSEKYPNDSYMHDKLRIVGLRTKDLFQGAIRKYELLTHISKGNFVFHTAGWGTGEILDFSLIREELSLEFEYVLGVKHLSFENALKTLLPLPKDHFLAKRFGNPDLFEEESRQDPVKTIRILLRDLGPKTSSEIKDELCELVIPEEEWSKWWQSAKTKMKKDRKIKAPASVKKPFILLDKEVSYEQSLFNALEEKPSTEQIIQTIYAFFRDHAEALKNEELKSKLYNKFKEVLASEKLTIAHQLQIHYFIQDLTNEKKYEPTKNIIESSENLTELINDIQIANFKKRTLILIKNVLENWEEIFYNQLFIIHPHLLRDYILQELLKTKDQEKLHKKIEQLLIHPITYPHVFVWYFQKIFNKKTEFPFGNEKGQKQFFEQFLVLLDHLSQKPELRDLGKKMIQILSNNRYENVRKIMEKTTKNEAQEYLLLTTKCRILSDHEIKIIHSLAEVIHPSLNTQKEEETFDVIYTSAKGYNKIHQRINEINDIEMIENERN